MSAAPEDDIVLRFLHTADWHLGKRFTKFRDEKRLTRARRDVLERIFGAAERNSVNAVLCAGDLFDQPNPEREWWESLAESLQKRDWKDRPVILLPGNHDPLLADSVWAPGTAFRQALPPWVHVVDRVPFVELKLADNAVLYAVPCTSKAGQRDPTLSIPLREPGDDRIRIGMVHGSTFDIEGCQTNFPIAVNAAVERGLDYLAIGDTHGFRFVPPDRKYPPTIYPGAPEPTAFDEKDPGHVAIVLVNRQRRASVQKERVAQWVWEECMVRTLDELRSLRSRGDLTNRVIRLTLDMQLPAPEYDEAEGILRDLEGTMANHARIGVLDLDRRGLHLDTGNLEELCNSLPSVLLAAVRRLKQAEQSAVDPEVPRRALYHLYRTAMKRAS